jgi:hypothetical protein
VSGLAVYFLFFSYSVDSSLCCYDIFSAASATHKSSLGFRDTSGLGIWKQKSTFLSHKYASGSSKLKSYRKEPIFAHWCIWMPWRGQSVNLQSFPLLSVKADDARLVVALQDYNHKMITNSKLISELLKKEHNIEMR